EIVAWRTPAQSRDVGFGEGTGADRAHVTAQHVDELRQLVETGGAEHAPDACDTAVSHRAEFEDCERPSFFAEAYLSKEKRRPILEQDRERDERHHGREEQQPADGPRQIEKPFHRAPPCLPPLCASILYIVK